MSDVVPDPSLDQPAKKRKRSGKERQQRKAELIAAAAAAAEAKGEAAGSAQGEDVAASEAKSIEHSAKEDPDEVTEAEGSMQVGAETEEKVAELAGDVLDLEKVQGRIVSLAASERPAHRLRC
jgi:hypothetical protein